MSTQFLMTDQYMDVSGIVLQLAVILFSPVGWYLLNVIDPCYDALPLVFRQQLLSCG